MSPDEMRQIKTPEGQIYLRLDDVLEWLEQELEGGMALWLRDEIFVGEIRKP
jgi:hypothetical protein